MHTSVAVDITSAVSTTRAPSVAVALIGPAFKTAPGMTLKIQEAITSGRVVIPVVDDLASFSSQCPAELSRYNGFEWSGAEPEHRLARILLKRHGD